MQRGGAKREGGLKNFEEQLQLLENAHGVLRKSNFWLSGTMVIERISMVSNKKAGDLVCSDIWRLLRRDATLRSKTSGIRWLECKIGLFENEIQ